jgi:uroporphyrin-III C-methyltransferase/precorrin-2 dehydrogenase/sirohydrochlorin ferrochelatase
LLAGHAADLVFAGREDEAREEFASAIAGQTAAPGIVFLVGAGPGPADLLTLRALRLLGEADVIVHDHLVSAAVLDMARRDAERIRLAAGDHGALLIRLARAGKKVVWLGVGEQAALAAAGVLVEIVPGVPPEPHR